jgi:GxxExxY protein
MTENDIAREVVQAAYEIHKSLGPGLFESVYESALTVELLQRGFHIERQHTMPVVYKGLAIEEAFRLDLMVEGKVIVELKSQETILPVHKKQLLTYLRLSGRKLGLLVNFGAENMRSGITRLVNGLEETSRANP